jgi:NAD+-dependent protein deacetylase sirtuin 2
MKTPVDIASLARYILSPDCQSIALLTGAGVSVASGIPDFRSPGGMYDTLRPDLITCSKYERLLMEGDPTYVVSWDIFQANAFPYLEVRRPFILGTQRRQWKATIAHRFAELLHVKTNKLTRVYTQNIDGLDRQCVLIPDDKIVSVHGTISKASCEDCGTEMDFESFCGEVSRNIKDIYKVDPDAPETSTPVLCRTCEKPLVKPSTVLFGRNLPDEFWNCARKDMPSLDLLLVAGTSLVVAPANCLVYNSAENAKRVVINLDPVGQELGIDYSNSNDSRDLFLQGPCDDIFLELIQELGWLDDLNVDTLPESSAKLVEAARKLNL